MEDEKIKEIQNILSKRDYKWNPKLGLYSEFRELEENIDEILEKMTAKRKEFGDRKWKLKENEEREYSKIVREYKIKCLVHHFFRSLYEGMKEEFMHPMPMANIDKENVLMVFQYLIVECWKEIIIKILLEGDFLSYWVNYWNSYDFTKVKKIGTAELIEDIYKYMNSTREGVAEEYCKELEEMVSEVAAYYNKVSCTEELISYNEYLEKSFFEFLSVFENKRIHANEDSSLFARSYVKISNEIATKKQKIKGLMDSIENTIKTLENKVCSDSRIQGTEEYNDQSEIMYTFVDISSHYIKGAKWVKENYCISSKYEEIEKSIEDIRSYIGYFDDCTSIVCEVNKIAEMVECFLQESQLLQFYNTNWKLGEKYNPKTLEEEYKKIMGENPKSLNLIGIEAWEYFVSNVGSAMLCSAFDTIITKKNTMLVRRKMIFELLFSIRKNRIVPKLLLEYIAFFIINVLCGILGKDNISDRTSSEWIIKEMVRKIDGEEVNKLNKTKTKFQEYIIRGLIKAIDEVDLDDIYLFVKEIKEKEEEKEKEQKGEKEEEQKEEKEEEQKGEKEDEKKKEEKRIEHRNNYIHIRDFSYIIEECLDNSYSYSNNESRMEFYREMILVDIVQSMILEK